MLKMHIIWLVITSVIALVLIWVFSGATFSHCYFDERFFHLVAYIEHDPARDCSLNLAIAGLFILVAIPFFLACVWSFIYWLITAKTVTYYAYVLWVSWAILVVYLSLQIRFWGA